MKRTLLILILCCIALPTAAAAAPANNSTAAGSSSASNASTAPTVPGDDALHIRDHHMDNGSMVVTLHADAYRPSVTLTSSSGESGAGIHTGHIRTLTLDPGETATVSIPAPTGTVALSSATSTANGRYAELTADTGPSVVPGGPYSGRDLVGFGGGIGLAFVVVGFYRAVEAREGSEDGGERLA